LFLPSLGLRTLSISHFKLLTFVKTITCFIIFSLQCHQLSNAHRCDIRNKYHLKCHSQSCHTIFKLH
jgi:hypothetical protein